jgi:ComF family protein
MPWDAAFSRLGIQARRWLAVLPDLARQALFCPQCRICSQPLLGRGEAAVCSDCLGRVSLDPRPCCPRCGLFFDRPGGPCGACRLKPPPFASHRSFAAYEGELRRLIVLYKYGEIEVLKKPLAGFLRERLEREQAGPFDRVVPVPGDPKRRREFQPAAELARALAGRLGLKLESGNLVKVRSTPAQAGLRREQRLRNLRGVFRLERPRELKKTRVLLVDDVFTTGSTLRACARELVRAGATVTAITVAQSVWQMDRAGMADGMKKTRSGD